jgi:hypothetical protein
MKVVLTEKEYALVSKVVANRLLEDSLPSHLKYAVELRLADITVGADKAWARDNGFAESEPTLEVSEASS